MSDLFFFHQFTLKHPWCFMDASLLMHIYVYKYVYICLYMSIISENVLFFYGEDWKRRRIMGKWGREEDKDR